MQSELVDFRHYFEIHDHLAWRNGPWRCAFIFCWCSSNFTLAATSLRTDAFDFTFVSLLKKLVKILSKFLVKDLSKENYQHQMKMNLNVALFIRQQLSIMDRGHTIDMVISFREITFC